MSNHAQKVKTAVASFEAAIATGDRDAAYAALLSAQVEAEAARKAKAAVPKAASAASTTADAEVVTACDCAKAALAASGPPMVTGVFDDLWSLFIANAPAILEWIRKLFSPSTP